MLLLTLSLCLVGTVVLGQNEDRSAKMCSTRTRASEMLLL